ncbi:helix-turn-helix domain-containing protein [Streptomyces sp. NPDC001275]
MDSGEHIGGREGHVHDEQNGHNPALTELRRRLTGGLARARLNQTQLATRAELGRTTVSEALSPKKPVPSSETVAALASALKLPGAGAAGVAAGCGRGVGHGHHGWAGAFDRGVGAA